MVARAAVLGALLPAPATEAQREQMHRFLVNLCQRETHDGSREARYLLDQARQMIQEAQAERAVAIGGRPSADIPRVLDSFAGEGGAFRWRRCAWAARPMP